jgi:hypothetical protein
MLTFDSHFVADSDSRCIIWADESVFGRVQFSIGSLILVDTLHGENPVASDRNRVLCEQKRSLIEAACKRAFKERPTEFVELQTRDFQ